MEHERSGDLVVELDGTERVSPAGPSPPHLLIVADDGTWTSKPLPTDGALTIGRGAQVDVRVDEQAVSRLHARLEVTRAGELRLVDLGSANGTLVGERLVRDVGVTVWPGEPILIGRTVLAVHAPQPTRGSKDAPRPPLESGRALADVDVLVAKAAPTMINVDALVAMAAPTMIDVDALVAMAAPTLISVLLLGETGVGKGVVAERIHRLSARAGRLVQLNCAGLSAALLESELFGHERGAFTGAAQPHPGLLEAAAGGTVFLDEVGEMPMEVQAKLLLAIEQRVARRVGATQSRPIDVRFLSATHKDLEAEIRRDRFRADFYYRINGLTIPIPPLRERRDELDGLIGRFASGAAACWGRDRVPAFDEDARARLHRYAWPGNVRELRNVVDRAVLLAEGDVVTSRVLVAAGLPTEAPPPPVAGGSAEDAKRDRVIAALAACGGNQSRAARMLRISRNTLIALIKRFGLARPRRREDLR
jgi:transcriptional regulator with AAA-type ATPase domain